MRFSVTLLILCAFRLFAADENPEGRFLSNTRQLIYDGKRSGEGYFSPDGKQLIFQSEREPENPFYQIYLLDLLSGDSARVSPGIGKTTCAFFQPGTNRVLFASTHLDPQALAKQKAEFDFRASGKQRRYSWDYDPEMDIFSCNQDGSEMVQLTKARGYDAEASFSPTGDEIVFCSTRAAYDQPESDPEVPRRLERDPAWFGDLYLMKADGSNVRRLTTTPGYDGGPFFSPSGSRIIWRRFDESGMNADVYTMDRSGGAVMRLADFKCMSWAPYYWPDESYVIFTANKLGFDNFELFIVDRNGEKEPVRVTYTPGFDGLPVFSPRGDKLCWTSGRTSDGKSQLFIEDWNHEAALKALAEAPKRQAATEPVQAAPPTEPKPAVTSLGPAIPSAFSPEITAADLKSQVAWLAADAREGRMTGTPGAQAAAEWIADYFKTIGLKPLGDSFYEPFEFDAGVQQLPEQNRLTILTQISENKGWNFVVTKQGKLKLDQDFRPMAFSDSGETEGEVVFAGYGLSVPDGSSARYNSYEGLDVKDKIVLVLRYVPEGVDAPRRAHLNRYAGLRYKVMMARERGAKAVLVASGPNSPQAGELLPLTGDGALAGSGVLAVSISGTTADALLESSGKKLKELQSALDTENPHAESGFVLPKVRVKLSVGVEHIKKNDRNVIAFLPSGLPTSRGDFTGGSAKVTHFPDPEAILIGAHYDHLGRGAAGSSMARSGEEGQIHHGADDNASGTAFVLELAASLATEQKSHPEKFKRNVVFALWSGEEIGLVGSAAFAARPPLDLTKVTAYLNADMVGRLRDNKLTVQGVGSSNLWRKLLEKRNVAAGFNLVLQDDPYLPTDTTSIYPKRIPVLNFFTGAHEDYHRPTDTAEKLDYDGLVRITNFARSLILDLASAPERPEFARVERSDSPGGSRETLRAYLGTIPDYTTEVKGVKISGVRGGSPAEKGGVQGGDIIVEFGAQKIANIYDYTYALDAVKIGTPVKVVVERNGKRQELTVTPEARK